MKKVSFLAMAACAAVMTGCITVNDNKIAESYKADVAPARFQTLIEPKQNLVSAEAEMNALFGVIKWGASEFSDRSFCDESFFSAFKSVSQVVKEAATFNACKANKCDVILNAKYTISVKDYFVFKKIICKVEGFPGVITGIKALEEPPAKK